MAQTRLKSGNLHMVGGDNGTSGQVLKSRADGTFEWGAAINPPTFSSVDYPGDDTALDPAGGQSLIINGSNFVSGITCSIGGTTPSSITLNSAAQITVTTPAKSAGTYTLVITNADGGSATASNAISYNGIPAFTNAAGSLASVFEGASINVSAAATEPDGGAITYAVTSGALPSGVSLNTSTGAITGTAPSVSASTTSNFTITATDDENQSTARAYSITVNPNLPEANFNVVTWTGTGSAQTINVGFEPDLIWFKSRNQGYDPDIYDSSRGTNNYLRTSSTITQYAASDQITSTSSTGFTLGTGNAINQNTTTYVAWCFKASGGTTSTGSGTGGVTNITTQVNSSLGFSMIKFTEGTGTSSTVNHGLGSTPELVLSKRISGNSQGWFTHHSSLSGSQYLFLNTGDAVATSSSVWNGTAPDSTKITLGPWQTETDDYGAQGRIIYAFKSVTGFSKIGTYTGNGSTNGPIVETGFKPAFLMYKAKDAATAWVIVDNERGRTGNPRNEYIFANTGGNAGANYDLVNFYSNGFQIVDSATTSNASGGTFIYIAFAANPDTTTPTLADSFNAQLYTGNGGTQSITGVGFKPDLVWVKARNVTYDHALTDSIRGVTHPIYLTNGAQLTNSTFITSFDSDGFSIGNNAVVNNNTNTYVAWSWKAGNLPSINTDGSTTAIVNANVAAGFSIVHLPSHAGSYTVGHGLSGVPDLIITRVYDGTSNWLVYNSVNGARNYMLLNTDAANTAATAGYEYDAVTSTTFTNLISASTLSYIHYCFKSISGFSKIGSYTGSGSSGNAQNIGFQPDFVMIKSTAQYNWNIYDSKRPSGSITGRYMLIANSNGSEITSSVVHIDLTSTGFSFPNGYDGTNKSSQDYIYMAFKIN